MTNPLKHVTSRCAALALITLLSAGSLCWAKTGRTYYTEDQLAAARDRIARYDWARAAVVAARNNAARWITMSDEELWDFVPPPEQLRALNVSFGVDCPVHRAEIFRKGANYPWITTDDQPFKVKCPVGGEVYPSNDFQPWNKDSITAEPEHGPEYMDNGAGWVNDEGRRFFFVGYYVFWHRWRAEILSAVPALGQAYLLTGDQAYAHKAAVLMARIGVDYDRLDYASQAYHSGQWPAGIPGRILDYIWTTSYSNDFAAAYDAIYPGLAGDPELTAFLSSHGIGDARRHIEQKLLGVLATDIMRGFIHGNEGMHQDALAALAVVLDNDDSSYGPTTRQMTDWIMTGGGDSEYLLWNGFYRDGHGGESSPGYSSGWNTHYYAMARLLPRLGVDIFANPKFKKMADIGLDMWIAGQYSPSIGDNGSILGAGPVGLSPIILGQALTHYGDARYAQALALTEAKSEGLLDRAFDEDQVRRIVEREGADMGLRSRNLGGYGLAVLESGQDPLRRGLTMYYGHAGGGHGHRDRLTIELTDQRFPAPVLSEMGYPAHWLAKNTYWTANTVSHYAVVVNEDGQQTLYPGRLEAFASAPGLQYADASADQVAYPSSTTMYRRAIAMVDMGPESYYLLDFYRVRGGFQHDYSFHGPAFPDFSVTGATPGPTQEKGTVAGPDVEFGGRPTLRAENGIAVDLYAGKEIINDSRSYDQRSLDGWALYSSRGVLTRKPGAVLTIPVTQVGPGPVRLLLRAWDYNVGANELVASLGGQTRTIRWEPGGEAGGRWLHADFDLPAPATELILTARETGQNYILLSSGGLSTDLTLQEPMVWDPAGSGFQYLFNVRRMSPAGTWSATWRDPDRDLALTSTLLAGSVQEVILTDAEPELKPGHPKTLQYLLARNTRSAPGNVESCYVNVIEPHSGPAQVGDVQRLSGQAPAFGTTGLSLRHGQVRDLIHSSLSGAETVAWTGAGKPFAAAGELAMVRVDGQGVQTATLVNGTLIRYGGFELRTAPPPTGKVLTVDHARNAITLDTALPRPQDLAGRVLILGNGRHSTSYTIHGATVSGGRTVVDLGDVLCTVGMGVVSGTDRAQNTVLTSTQLWGYGKVDGGQHQGRWLYNEDYSRGFEITRAAGGRLALESAGADLDQVFTDANGDGRRQFWISDIGPDDSFRLPTVTQARRVRTGVYHLEVMGRSSLALPR